MPRYVDFVQVFCECSVEEAVARDSSRPPGARVGTEVVKNMSSKLEPPSTAESWEAASTIQFGMDVDVAVVTKRLLTITAFKVSRL